MKRFLKKIFILPVALTFSANIFNSTWAEDAVQNNFPETALYEAAKKGVLRDQYRLGLECLFNSKVNKQADAFFWIHSAADQGFAAAQFVLAWMLANGVGGVEKDLASSQDWLELAAKSGNTNAQEVLNGATFDKIIEDIKKSIKN